MNPQQRASASKILNQLHNHIATLQHLLLEAQALHAKLFRLIKAPEKKP